MSDHTAKGFGLPTTGFVPKKSFGQNFLVDRAKLKRIVEACELDPEETILEIGPGQGALTRELAPFVKHIIAVEADRHLVASLKKEFDPEKLTVHHADFLKFDLSDIPKGIKVIGNLPYNISTPIITRVIEHRDIFSSLFMTVQLEFGERLVAPVGRKDYGSLSIFVRSYADTKLLFKIGNRSFRPVPKVNSCFMRMDLRKEHAAGVMDERLFESVVKHAFTQRRKVVVNALGGLAPKDVLTGILERAKIAPQTRAEQIDVEGYARITNELVNVRKG